MLCERLDDFAGLRRLLDVLADHVGAQRRLARDTRPLRSSCFQTTCQCGGCLERSSSRTVVEASRRMLLVACASDQRIGGRCRYALEQVSVERGLTHLHPLSNVPLSGLQSLSRLGDRASVDLNLHLCRTCFYDLSHRRTLLSLNGELIRRGDFLLS